LTEAHDSETRVIASAYHEELAFRQEECQASVNMGVPYDLDQAFKLAEDSFTHKIKRVNAKFTRDFHALQLTCGSYRDLWT
jgi:hypothetical protein